ncbi:MAG: hypothetical protein GYB68_15895, partial [Chloroflexi bacterium]|nr:hypothetical protein [Chloroflexota bacterium]
VAFEIDPAAVFYGTEEAEAIRFKWDIEGEPEFVGIEVVNEDGQVDVIDLNDSQIEDREYIISARELSGRFGWGLHEVILLIDDDETEPQTLNLQRYICEISPQTPLFNYSDIQEPLSIEDRADVDVAIVGGRHDERPLVLLQDEEKLQPFAWMPFDELLNNDICDFSPTFDELREIDPDGGLSIDN